MSDGATGKVVQGEIRSNFEEPLKKIPDGNLNLRN